MKSRDSGMISRDARREMEDFINQHLDDKAKGWPKSSLSGEDSSGAEPVQKVRKANRIRMPRSESHGSGRVPRLRK